MNTHWLIYSPQARLWWSNEIGWVGRKSATVFLVVEKQRLNLPIGGKWVPL